MTSFNPRTRTGCDLSRLADFYSAQVSIHAPARGATASDLGQGLPLLCFNPRTRTGCDPEYPTFKREIICFNPRTRTGCDITIYKTISGRQSFNPRTRTGCDGGLENFKPLQTVSIHAPARGATNLPFTTLSALLFQSTHPHGVRLAEAIVSDLNASFNPRTRTGCDSDNVVRFGGIDVSIHAPARGATKHIYNDICEGEFQSTHPHGVRPPLSDYPTLSRRRFNPRTRTGCDPGKLHGIKIRISVSIHAPARGATPLSQSLDQSHTGFNPRTRTGCDLHAIY